MSGKHQISLICICLCITTKVVHAQHLSAEDSLKLARMLSQEGEVFINKAVIKKLDFGAQPDALKSPPSNTLEFDQTLPFLGSDTIARKDPRMTILLYTPWTKYNWDPFYQAKIKIDKDTWKKKSTHVIIRPNGEIEYIDLNVAMFDGIGSMRNLRMMMMGGTVNGTIGDIDLMSTFTEKFWDFKGKKMQKKTLEVLKTYNDSTASITQPSFLRVEKKKAKSEK